MEFQKEPKVRAALALRALKKEARKKAEHDLTHRRTTRNVSAWLSRASNRHYEALLVGHVKSLEEEKEQFQQLCNKERVEIMELRKMITQLEYHYEIAQKSKEKLLKEAVDETDRVVDLVDLAIWPDGDCVL